MFSSSNPTFPHLIPSSSTNVVFSPSNSFFDNEKDDVDFHNSFLSGDFKIHHAYNNTHVHPQDAAVVKELVMQEQHEQQQQQQQQLSEGSGLQYSEDYHDDLLDSVISPYSKKMEASKKDGHSKIYTAQGPRDRRVRLSIDIARKFFCLQDLLGFDKASKTLDWLLSKSLTSIKDLVTQCSSSTTVTEESKFKFLETIENIGNKKKKAVVVKCVEPRKKKTTQRCNLVQDNVAREQLRTEARARARERTKEKMRVKKLDGWLQIEQQNDYKDSSFQIRGFHEHLGDHGINDLDLE